MFERFTDRARKVMQLANQEAQLFNHEYIGTEHILLGLVKEGSGVAANVLHNLGVELRKVRLAVEELVQTGPETVTTAKLPHTPRAKKVIEYAMHEARGLGHNYVGTEHLLLGLLREGEGVGAQVLMKLRLKLEEVREEVLVLLEPGIEGRLPMDASTTTPKVSPEPFTDRARIVMQLANQEAQRFNHECIGTEHILLGLVKEGSGVAANVLKNLGVDLRKVRVEVEKLVQTGPEMVTMGKLPHTPRAKKVVEYAMDEARGLDHNYVGTEHLLLGELREVEGVGAHVLMNLGVNLDMLREAVLDILGHSGEAGRFSQWPLKRASTVSWVPGYAISNFSRRARDVLQNAEHAARELDHGNVSTAHLVLSLVKGGDTAAGAVLREAGLTAENLRKALEGPLLEFPPWPANDNSEYTARLCQVLEQAMREARRHSPRAALLARLDELREQKEQAMASQDFEAAARLYDEAVEIKNQLPDHAWSVEPEHLLLGLLNEPHGVAVRIIQDLGLHHEQLRAEALRRLEQQVD